MIVLDASTVLEVLLQTAASATVLRRIAAAPADLHAPELIDVEVAQVLRRFTRARMVTPGRAALALEHLAAFPLRRHPHRPFLRRVWELRENVTAFDAIYLALAEALGAPLLTTDRKLARVPGLETDVELV
jgi:predicted nucleic acid-binding protein